MNNQYQKIKDLVAKDKLAEAFEILKDLVRENKQANHLVIQTARYYDLEKAINLNILEWDKIKIEKSQIRLALLSLVDELEAEEKEDQKFIFDTDGKERTFQQDSSKASTPIQYEEKSDTDVKLEGLILRFLTVFSTWYFSPLRMQKWGSQQHGFEELGNYSVNSISTVLKNLLTAGRIKTTVSKKGNPIYKIR